MPGETSSKPSYLDIQPSNLDDQKIDPYVTLNQIGEPPSPLRIKPNS